MNYRLATTADAATLAEMRWDFRLEETPGETATAKTEFLEFCTAFMVAGIERGEWWFWVAEDETTTSLVACICIQIVSKIPKPNKLMDAYGYVTNVYTRSAYRNQGIGSLLMQAVVAWASSRDLENLVVWPSERSVPFYGRAGFLLDNEALSLSLRPSVA